MNDNNGKPRKDLVPFDQQLKVEQDKWRQSLPKHVDLERFARVVVTAINSNPDLWTKGERRSFWAACTKAAHDGLYPDGREAALVLFNGRVTYMPMIAGIRKLVRNSGQIATWETDVVYSGDHWDYARGDDPYIVHRPRLDADRGTMIAAYSIARLKSGEVSREVMNREQIEKRQRVSRTGKSADGPWAQWPEEMWRKTVAHAHSRSLPMSSDLESAFAHDEEATYSTAPEERDEEDRVIAPSTLSERLSKLAGPTVHDDIDPDTGEVTPSTNDNAPPPEPHTEAETGDSVGAPPEMTTESPPPLDASQVLKLKALHETMSGLMTLTRVVNAAQVYRSKWSPIGRHAALADLLDKTHRSRVEGRSSPADCDNAFRRALEFSEAQP